MQNLKKWTEAQLKKGYTITHIKQILTGYGYPQKVVAEVDKIFFHKTRKKKIELTAVILLIIISSVFIFNIPRNTSAQSLCAEFAESEYKISCNKAVALALADRPGTVQDISVGTKRIPTGSEGKTLIKDTRLWLIDIRLDEPFYDENLNKEIKLLRVGIGTDEHLGVHRESIK